ncbi:MAG: hypothetical protein SynsKO_14550 [Synoicihabitans sp.]
MRFLSAPPLLVLLVTFLAPARSATVPTSWFDSGPLAFGQAELAASGFAQPLELHLESTIPPQAYKISARSVTETVVLRAGDPTGFMYGLLEIAERHRLHGDEARLIGVSGTPHIERRGIKFNIPLDVRTPSYDDSGDAAQRNIAEMWNLAFWTEFFDQMARDRYNMISFWNPHPFPSMVKSEAFPDVALDDVRVTTLEPNGRENEWGDAQLVSRSVVENYRTVKTMTIDEKIEFWRKVMRHAKDRGIDVYWITWNICLNGAAQPVHDYYRTYGTTVPEEEPGKYGITHDMNNPVTVRYVRDAVKTFLLTYPDVTGIGVTAGEHFPASNGPKIDREDWLWSTYGEGILDAKREQPDRPVRFIHRVWNTEFDTIMDRWGRYPDDFEISFKYAKARLYSSPHMPFADNLVDAMKPLGLKSWWNLRNDDIFVHRWGDPTYVSQFIKNFDVPSTAGFHMGSDGYVWGREFSSKSPHAPRELEISKHWYKFMLWGRLGYDPDLDRDFFIARIAERFPETDAEKLHDSWQTASQIIPLVNRFYWRDWDHMWSVENSNSHKEGYHDIEAFANGRTMDGSGLLNIRDYVAAQLSGRRSSGITPIEVANKLDQLAELTLAQVTALSGAANGQDLQATLDDMKGMALLGQFYADKIHAATHWGFYQATDDSKYRDLAGQSALASYEHCTDYVDHSQRRYHSQMLARSGPLHWPTLLVNARGDLARVLGVTRHNPSR